MTLDELRKEIDDVDKNIKALFIKRMEIIEQIAEIKAENNDDIFKPERETEILKSCTRGLDSTLKEPYTALVRKLITLSREHQYKALVKSGHLSEVSISGYQPKHNRLEVSFNCDDTCGSLTYVLSIISDYGVNIKNLTLNNVSENGHVDYRVDLLLDMGLSTDKEIALITQLMKETDDFKISGSYKI